MFLLPQLLLESIASNDLLGPVCIVHRREGAAILRQAASGHMHYSDPLGAGGLETLTLEPREACVPVNRGRRLFFLCLRNSGVTAHKKSHRKRALPDEENIAFTCLSLSVGVCLPFPPNLES